MYKFFIYFFLFISITITNFIYADTKSANSNNEFVNEEFNKKNPDDFIFFFGVGYGLGDLRGIDKSGNYSDAFGGELQMGVVINEKMSFSLRFAGYGEVLNTKMDGSGYKTSYGIGEYHFVFTYYPVTIYKFIFEEKSGYNLYWSINTGVGGAQISYETDNPDYMNKYLNKKEDNGISYLIGTGISMIPYRINACNIIGMSGGIYFSYQQYIYPNKFNNTYCIGYYCSVLIFI